MKKKIGIILSVTLFLSVWFVIASSVINVRATHEYLIAKHYRFENITEEGIVQYFSPKYERLDEIELFIANVYPETDGKINITILDGGGKKIFQKKYRASKIPTGEFVSYHIGKKMKPGTTYELQLSYDGESVESPQIMVSARDKNLLDTEEMIIDGTVSDYNMAIIYHYSEKSLFGY